MRGLRGIAVVLALMGIIGFIAERRAYARRMQATGQVTGVTIIGRPDMNAWMDQIQEQVNQLISTSGQNTTNIATLTQALADLTTRVQTLETACNCIPPGPTPAPTAVHVTGPASVVANTKAQYQASVDPATANQGVTWGANIGSITQTGMYSAGVTQGNDVITATALNSTVKGTIPVTITPPTGAASPDGTTCNVPNFACTIVDAANNSYAFSPQVSADSRGNLVLKNAVLTTDAGITLLIDNGSRMYIKTKTGTWWGPVGFTHNCGQGAVPAC